MRRIHAADHRAVDARHQAIRPVLRPHLVWRGHGAVFGRDDAPAAPQAYRLDRLGRDLETQHPLHGLRRLGEHPADGLARVRQQALGELREVTLATELLAENGLSAAGRAAVAEALGEVHRAERRADRPFGAALEDPPPPAGALE